MKQVIDKKILEIAKEPFVFWDSYKGKLVEIKRPHHLDKLCYRNTDKGITVSQYIVLKEKQIRKVVE